MTNNYPVSPPRDRLGDEKRSSGDEADGLDFPWKWVRPLLIGAAVYALYRTVQTGLAGPEAIDPRLSNGRRLIMSLADGTLMALLAPVALLVSRRFPVGPPHLARNVFAHLVAAFASAGVWVVLLLACFSAVTGRALRNPLRTDYLGWFTTNIVVYAGVVAVLHALAFQRRYRDRDLDAARLQAQLSSARLDMLRAQLHPHFLFNTLHTISELIHIDPQAADKMVIRLGQLLRASLDSSAKSEFPLAREIELVTAYLDLQRMRYGDRLAVHIHIEPALSGALVPPVILQPLVENALRHGVSRRSAPGNIWISALRNNGGLRLVVEDDGVGLPDEVREGVGLTNVRTRLAELFGPVHRMELTPRPGGGAIATIDMPLRLA